MQGHDPSLDFARVLRVLQRVLPVEFLRLFKREYVFREQEGGALVGRLVI